MIRARFLPPAEEEMIEAAAFYEAAAEGLGHDFLNDIQRIIDLLLDHPTIGRDVGGSLRQALLKRFPHYLIYSFELDSILIIAVAHQRRRPDYWRGRG